MHSFFVERQVVDEKSENIKTILAEGQTFSIILFLLCFLTFQLHLIFTLPMILTLMHYHFV